MPVGPAGNGAEPPEPLVLVTVGELSVVAAEPVGSPELEEVDTASAEVGSVTVVAVWPLET